MSIVSRKPKFLILVSVFVFLAAFLFAQAPQATEANTDRVPGHYIVELAPHVNVAEVANEMARTHGLAIGHVYNHAIKGFSARIPDGRLNVLQNDNRILNIQPDLIVSIQVQAHPGQTSYSVMAQTIPTGITRIDGHLSSAQAGNGSGSVDVDVAILDTGIQTNHPDLNVVGGKNCARGKNTIEDGHGHGTHVAGTVAAKDDGNGVVGVAPGARLWAVRVLDNNGSGTTSSVICGIDWVTANASIIEVANMSLGGSGSDSVCGGSDSYHNAICNSVAAGVTYVVAAGNSSADANNFRPATYEEVITVSALADFDGVAGGLGSPTCRTDEDDTFANFSNYGADVDLIAPGVCILSTWKGSGYSTISGTSMASPHVAGAAALYLANNPGKTPAQVKAALINAGNFDWNNVDDPDGIKEPLLNVKNF